MSDSRPVPPRPHRPARYADLTALIDAGGGDSPSARAELAAATAAAVVGAARDGSRPDDGPHPAPLPPGDPYRRFVALADEVGIDTLAELWRGSDPVSLPGALWAVYLLRQWLRQDGHEVARMWRAGAPLAPADAVVAGVPDARDVAEVVDAASMAAVADALLRGLFGGDLAVALERSAAVFRVLATGRRDLALSTASDTVPGTEPATVRSEAARRELEHAERNEKVAADLAAAALRWREGTLH